MTELRIAIAGAGGFGRETADAVRDLYPGTGVFAGFLDDAMPGLLIADQVMGPIELIRELADVRLVICVGNPRNYFARAEIVERLGLAERRYATIVHPSAQVSRSSTVGAGSVLLAGVVLTADATISRHVAVMPHVVVTHDVVVRDYATLASGVKLGGGVVVDEGAYVGAGAMVREGVHIGAWSQVGMGSVVLQDVPECQVWVGNPARKLRDVVRPESLAHRAALR
ncbi:acetyltransferase [Catenulispora acidiphila DSM 44928]|uniref:Acetyltransferase n=1 Tax=Catenulispora acidiphila (strain DSM 44928 / JCM 14897 / NBRC 102108 / NRRL B-24433 / ID139908) TaxID=479433 RepID=C7PYJ9_CATAD|nr:NeuD/PglB/VioB family sugar acetyltransferase [Catenulispora acidiphila]ACU77321.1 acetyltransferase [Catenulispora acidiphila DSM 44928]